ncbi:olfactory receptor 5AR1-like [Rhinophrynus dorsalis]
MYRNNDTTITEFILVGLSDNPDIQVLLFIVFLCIFVITLLGNTAIIFAYIFISDLHTPMYFFLANFSFLEICYVVSTVPKLLTILLTDNNTISFSNCAVQMYFFLLFCGTECYMLAVMAYDRYNAICQPLLYSTIMSKRTCFQLIAGSWILGSVNSLVHTVLTFSLPFCGANQIYHFICDVPPLLNLACKDTWINELGVFVIAGSVIFGSFILTMSSYIKIITTILHIHSTTGRKNAFSTCTSHFIVVTTFYSSSSFMYFRPRTSYEMGRDRVIAVMYTVITPLLNPFVYTLRNRDVKVAVIKKIQQLMTIHNKY